MCLSSYWEEENLLSQSSYSAVGGPSSYLEPARTKGLSHFHSAHMPVSPGGGQQLENRGELEGRQISNSKLGLLSVFFFFLSFSDKVKYDLQRKKEIAFYKSTDKNCCSCNTRTLQPAISHTHFIDFCLALMKTSKHGTACLRYDSVSRCRHVKKCSSSPLTGGGFRPPGSRSHNQLCPLTNSKD